MIPVAVLTGFLGSGKTTLLSHLLRQPEFARTAVLINEFGEVGLDHELVEASDDSFIELSTGCLCCKVRSDLARTIDDILCRRECAKLPPFDRIVIETSGLADPAPILQTLMTDVKLAGRIVLGDVVATVDAVNGLDTLEREEVSAKQVALADHLVLTKSDLANGAQPQLLDRLAALNSGAPLLYAHHGKIEPQSIFDAGGLESRAKFLDDGTWLVNEACEHSHDRHAGIKTFALVREAPIRAVALTLLLEALAEHCGADLLRLKAIVQIAEYPEKPAVLHGVQHVFHPPAWLKRWPSGERRSRLVFITRRIPRAWVEALLDAVEAEVAEVEEAETHQNRRPARRHAAMRDPDH